MDFQTQNLGPHERGANNEIITIARIKEGKHWSESILDRTTGGIDNTRAKKLLFAGCVRFQGFFVSRI